MNLDKKQISILLGISCVILTLGIVVQIRTISSKISSVDSAYVNDDLRDEVLKIKDNYEEKYKQLEKAQLLLEKKRAKATENDGNTTQKEEELKKGEAILGLSDVSGKGIEITLNDSQTKSLRTLEAGEDISNFIVHVGDLQNVVNELRNAGAQAISINDQRIIASTKFECAGNIIRIDKAIVGAPFKIKAIGKQDDLYGALKRGGGYLDYLKTECGLEVKIDKPSTNLTILKYTGTMKPKYMKQAN